MLFSIVVPTFNRAREIERCIESIGAMTDDTSTIEVVIVNDGGQAPDADRLRNLAGHVVLRLFDQSRLGPGAARNNGAFHAHGEYLAFIDDDCVLPPDWIARARDSVRRHPATMIGGLTINLLTNNIFAEASQALVDYVIAHYSDAAPGRIPLYPSNNIIVPAAMFQQFGGFDESFRAAEDRDLCRRWQRQNLSMIRDETVVVHHAHHLGPAGLLRQHFGYGRGAFAYRRNEGALRVEPLSFYAGMLSYPFRTKRRHPLALSALMVVTQLANAAGFARQAASRARTGHEPDPYCAPGPL